MMPRTLWQSWRSLSGQRGAVVVGTLIQKRELMHPGTYVGTGKVAEIAAMIAERGATGHRL